MEDDKKIKVTFYKSIMGAEGLTPTDKIVFCQMLYLSLMNKEDRYAFDSEGNFTLSEIMENFNGYVPLSWRANESFIMSRLGISRMQYYLSIKHIKERGLMVSDSRGFKYLYVIPLVPYFELNMDVGLRGLELIVYSYLVNKETLAAKDDGWVDKYHNAIAEDLCFPISKKRQRSDCLDHVLYRLAQKGYLKRSRHGSYRVWLKTTLPGER